MHNATFGELSFSTGWKTKTELSLFGASYDVVVKVKAYFEKDGVTAEQESAYTDFIKNKNALLVTVEKQLNAYDECNSTERFIPRTLLFQRNGGYALLLDDKQDEDGGVAVCLAPKEEVVAQDDYL